MSYVHSAYVHLGSIYGNVLAIDVALEYLSLNLNIFHIFLHCFYCWLWASKYLLDIPICRPRTEIYRPDEICFHLNFVGSRSNWYQFGYKTCHIPKGKKFYCGKGIFMLTGLKVPSLTCKCVSYRPEYNAKTGSHRIEYRFQRADKKNGATCLVIMFTPKVMFIQM